MEEKESEPFCFNCQKNVPAANFATHSAFCEKHIKICKLCNEAIPITGEEDHLKEYHVTVACDMCGVALEKWMHVKHKELCPRRLTHCEFCDSEFPFNDHAEHVDFCSSRTEKCMKCQKYIMLKDKEKHTEFHLSERFCNLAVDSRVEPNIFNDEVLIDRIVGCNTPKKELCPRRLTHCEFCDSEFPFNEYAEHVDFCSSRTEKCILCQKYIMLKDKGKHTELHLSERRFCNLDVDSEVKQNIINEVITDNLVGPNTPEKELCLERMAHCEFCGLEFSFDEYDEHLDFCSSRTEKCMLCPKYVMLKDKEKHVETHIVHQHNLSSERAIVGQNSTHHKSQVSVGANETDESNEELCPERVAPCEFCGSEFPFEEFVVHVDFCSSKTEKCVLCPKYIMLKDREKHREEHMNNPHGINSERTLVNQNYTHSENKFLAGASAITVKSDEMSKRYGVCHICKGTVPWIDMNTHIPNCASNAGKCACCGEEVPYHALKEHIINKKCKTLVQTKNPSCTRSDLDSTSRYGSIHVAQNDLLEDLPPVKCSSCGQLYSADRISQHMRNCYEHFYECPFCLEKLPEKNKVSHESFHCKALLQMNEQSFGDLSFMDSSKTTPKEKPSEKCKTSKKYSHCSECGDKMREDRMTNHLLVCQSKKISCVFCKEKICKTDKSHASKCKAFQSIPQKPDSRETKDFKGAVPKNSKFAKMVNVQVAKCKFCGTTLNDNILCFHEAECVHRMEPCMKCCVSVKLKDQEYHTCNPNRGKKKNNEANMGMKQQVKNWFGLGKSKSNDAHGNTGQEFNFSSQTYFSDCTPTSSYHSSFNPCNYSNRYNDYHFSKPEFDEPNIPCEFCGKLFSTSDIILHSTGCKPDEIYIIRRDASEALKRSEQNSNESNHVQSSVTTENLFPAKSQKHQQSTVRQGEFLENFSSESISSKPEVEVAKECHESKLYSGSKTNFRSVWNVSPETVKEEVDLKILPSNLLSEKITTDKQQDSKREVPGIKHRQAVEEKDEMSHMLDFIADEKTGGSGQSSSDQSEDEYSASYLKNHKLTVSEENARYERKAFKIESAASASHSDLSAKKCQEFEQVSKNEEHPQVHDSSEKRSETVHSRTLVGEDFLRWTKWQAKSSEST